MFKNKLQTAYILSLIILGLVFIASGGGIMFKEIYRDSDFFNTAWFGNDIVTFFVVVPMMLYSVQRAKKGSERALLVWMGILGYIIYNYAFYLFGAAFNYFFLLYVAIVSVSIYALVTGLSGMDLKAISRKFSYKTPVRAISIFLLFISLPLAIVEGSMYVNFLITGKLPEIPTLILALDLSIIIPNTALAAVLLWKRKVWGFILGVIMLVKGFTYGSVLSLSTALIANTLPNGTWDPLMPFYLFVAVGSLIAGYVLLKNLKTTINY